jgi:hypothetical protein
VGVDLALEAGLAMGDALVGLFADPGDLGLGPLADGGDVVVGLLAQLAGLDRGRCVDVLDVALGVGGEARERVGLRRLGRALHGLGEIGHELVGLGGLPAGRRSVGGRGGIRSRVDRLVALGGGLRNGRLVVDVGRVVRGGRRCVDHVWRLDLLVGSKGFADRRITRRLGTGLGLASVRTPREAKSGLGIGRGHAMGSSGLVWAGAVLGVSA